MPRHSGPASVRFLRVCSRARALPFFLPHFPSAPREVRPACPDPTAERRAPSPSCSDVELADVKNDPAFRRLLDRIWDYAPVFEAR